MSERGPRVPGQEQLSDFEIFIYVVHWISIQDGQQEDVAALQDIYELMDTGAATAHDEERFHDIAEGIWHRYDDVLRFDRLALILDLNPEVFDAMQRMAFLAIIDHIQTRDSAPQEQERADALAPYLDQARAFIKRNSQNPNAAFAWLERVVKKAETSFLNSVYFSEDTPA